VNLTQFLTGRKHGQSIEASEYEFYDSIANRSLQKQCKNYRKNSRSDQGDGRTIDPPLKYATELVFYNRNDMFQPARS